MTDEPAATPSAALPDPEAECPRCGKPPPLCVCESIAPMDNTVSLLILQHPQEQDRELGTARLTALHFKNALMKIGLSWASLSKILGRPADPQRWGILYLGSVRAAAVLPDREIVAVDKNGQALDRQDQVLRGLEGIILLDGTWSQAKALWWRNAWMLKCRRLVLGPRRASRYGKLRREPRSDGLSTLEAAALVMARLERKPEIETALTASFERLLERYRETHPFPPRGSGRKDRRHRSGPEGGCPGSHRRARLTHIVIAGHSPSKTGVNALMTRQSIVLKQLFLGWMRGSSPRMTSQQFWPNGFGYARSRSCSRLVRLQSSGWMCTIQPSWSTYQAETGLVELSMKDSRSMLKGSGRV